MSNLAGTTWLFKDTPSLTSCGCSATGNLFFTGISNNISILVDSSTICYTTITDVEEPVYDTSSDGWQDNALKIISFISEPTTFTPNENTFITWLEANATKQEKNLIDVVDAKILYDDLRERIDTKASIDNPKFTGTISHGRKENSESGPNSITFGWYNEAHGDYSSAIGNGLIAEGRCQHVIGKNNVDDTVTDWNNSTQYHVGDVVSYHGTVDMGTLGSYDVIGSYRCIQDNININPYQSGQANQYWENANFNHYAEIVGNGTNYSTRSNARALDWNGNEYLKGTLYVKGTNADASGGSEVAVKNNPTFTGSFTFGSTTVTEEFFNHPASLAPISNSEIDALFE